VTRRALRVPATAWVVVIAHSGAYTKPVPWMEGRPHSGAVVHEGLDVEQAAARF
jgi:hypothetical protein